MANRKTCPHCNGLFPANTYKRHMRVCFDDPNVRDRIIAYLLDTATDGTAIPQRDYAEAAPAHGFPSLKLIATRFGSWTQFVESIGLKSAKATQDIDWEMVYTELRRLSAELHDGTIAPNQQEWDLFRELHSVKLYMLTRQRRWEDICESAGLTLLRQKYYRNLNAERKRQWQSIQRKRDLCADTEHARTRAIDFPLAHIDRGVKPIWDCFTKQYITAQVYELR